MIPTGDCWVPIKVGTQPLQIPHGSQRGDRLMWLNGSWVSVPQSFQGTVIPGQCCGSGHTRRLIAVRTSDLSPDVLATKAPAHGAREVPILDRPSARLMSFDDALRQWKMSPAPEGVALLDITTGTVYMATQHGAVPVTGARSARVVIVGDGYQKVWTVPLEMRGTPAAVVVDKDTGHVEDSGTVAVTISNGAITVTAANPVPRGRTYEVIVFVF